MTVQELIDKLQQVEDKTTPVRFYTLEGSRFVFNEPVENVSLIDYGAMVARESEEWVRIRRMGLESIGKDLSIDLWYKHAIEKYGSIEGYIKRDAGKKVVYFTNMFQFHDELVIKKL